MPPPSRMSRRGIPLPLAVDRLSCGSRVLAGHPDALFALLQEAGLVQDEDATLFLTEMLHYVAPQVVSDRLRVPPGAVQQSLHALGVVLAHGLGHLPAVVALDAAE